MWIKYDFNICINVHTRTLEDLKRFRTPTSPVSLALRRLMREGAGQKLGLAVFAVSVLSSLLLPISAFSLNMLTNIVGFSFTLLLSVISSYFVVFKFLVSNLYCPYVVWGHPLEHS